MWTLDTMITGLLIVCTHTVGLSLGMLRPYHIFSLKCSTLMSDTSHERKQIKHFWLVLDLNVGALQVSFENDPILNETFANSFNQAFPPPSLVCKK